MNKTNIRFLALSLAGALGLILAANAPAAATELQVLQGNPSAKQLEDALAPKGSAAPASTVRFRGITLGNQKPAAAPAATTVAAPAPTAAPAAKPATTPAAAAAPAAGAPTQAVAAVAINIMFAFNSDQLTPQGRQILDNLGQALNSDRLKGNRFMLEGHTDSKGSDAYNQALSERRARSAMDYLVAAHKVDRARLVTVGKGESEPLDPANPERDINRRVQVMNLGS
ncbi:MAG: OmpA family protein [Rhodospirillales bacterium]|nr:OmpA family protein [Rhodospirillales bacterium]